MKIGALTITSPIHDPKIIEKSTQEYIEALKKESGLQIEIFHDVKKISDYDFTVLYVATGGTEGIFKTFYKELPPYIFILTSGAHNSLAASMEILSFLQQHDLSGQIIHGSEKYVASQMAKYATFNKIKTVLSKTRLGVIGKPSDWLIASDVDYTAAKDALGVDIIDVDIEEVIKNFENTATVDENLIKKFNLENFDRNEVIKALRVYLGVKKIVNDYKLDGIALRCFDLLGSIKTTGCLALALLNSEGIVASCEGDIPCMISMRIIYLLTSQSCFMCNPSRLNVEENTGVFAHCTLPMDMCKEAHTLKTHFESNIGVGICGKIKEGDVTIFKLGNEMNEYFVSDGKVKKNMEETNLCRTQIELELEEDMCYFLNAPLSNHHLVTYGHHSSLIHEFMSFLG